MCWEIARTRLAQHRVSLSVAPGRNDIKRNKRDGSDLHEMIIRSPTFLTVWTEFSEFLRSADIAASLGAFANSPVRLTEAGNHWLKAFVADRLFFDRLLLPAVIVPVSLELVLFILICRMRCIKRLFRFWFPDQHNNQFVFVIAQTSLNFPGFRTVFGLKRITLAWLAAIKRTFNL